MEIDMKFIRFIALMLAVVFMTSSCGGQTDGKNSSANETTAEQTENKNPVTGCQRVRPDCIGYRRWPDFGLGTIRGYSDGVSCGLFIECPADYGMGYVKYFCGYRGDRGCGQSAEVDSRQTEKVINESKPPKSLLFRRLLHIKLFLLCVKPCKTEKSAKRW